MQTHVKKGQLVEVRIPEISSETLTAEVFMVGQSINEARQINVHADLKDESKESLLVPGMFIEAKSKLILKKVCQSHKQQWLSLMANVMSWCLEKRKKMGFLWRK